MFFYSEHVDGDDQESDEIEVPDVRRENESTGVQEEEISVITKGKKSEE